MNIRFYIALFLVGYTFGGAFYEMNPEFGKFTLYTLIPVGITLDNLYVSFQGFMEIFQEYNKTVEVAPVLPEVQEEAQKLLAFLLPTLGYDIFNQYDVNELLSLYLQAVDLNTELSLESFLINASFNSLIIFPLFITEQIEYQIKRKLYLNSC